MHLQLLRAQWWSFLVVLFMPPAGAGRNRVWPQDLSLDATSLHKLRQDVCKRSGRREEKDTQALELLVRNQQTIEAQGFPATPGAGGFLPQLLKQRGGRVPRELSDVSLKCGQAATDDSISDCSSAWENYFSDVALPFAIPIVLGALSMCLHCVCCFVACCRCCRRMVCCKERMAPRNASTLIVVVTMLIWIPVGVAIFVLGAAVHINNFDFHRQLNWHLCTVLVVADEAVYGNDNMFFLGTTKIYDYLVRIAAALDVDGQSQATIQSVLQQSSNFAQKQQQLYRRLAHFTTVLNMSGPSFRTFEHRCVFCSLAVGDANNVFPAYPAAGLLPTLSSEISDSASQAMDGIRQYTDSRLTGGNLTSLASTVKRSVGATNLVDMGLRSAFVNSWARRLPSLDTAESIRIVVFVCVGMSAMASAVLGWLAFFITRWRRRQRPDVVPSGKPHCGSWCCGFCYCTAALLLGGGLLVVVIFMGEGCVWLRTEVLDHTGFARHAAAFGLSAEAAKVLKYYDASARQAVADIAMDVSRSCFTPNSTGNMLLQMGLDAAFAFEPDLSNAFYRLDLRVSDPPAGQKTALYLQTLRTAAVQFGGTFVLDPISGDNTSLGVLQLNPNIRALLLGSTIVPGNTKDPSGQVTLQGLNSYAALVAGPGKYTFAHGTAGGGFVITHDRPNSMELASLPLNVRNALLYGRAKEQFLVSNDSLRCDELDTVSGAVTLKRCSVQAFHAFVQAETGRLENAVNAVSAASSQVQHLFLNELRNQLTPTLRLVRDLRQQTTCRFLWRRIEAFDDSTCESLAPSVARVGFMNCLLASAGFFGIILHYKVWRHLKDNKVIGQELARFERTYEGFQHKMRVLQEEHDRKEARQQAYQQAIEEMTAAAVDSGLSSFQKKSPSEAGDDGMDYVIQ